MVTDQPGISFGTVLRQLRAGVMLTQEELAEAAGLSPRSVSDLERGINRTARKETALLLAGALGLTGQAIALFVAAARGRVPAGRVLAALQDASADAQVVQGGAARVLPAGSAMPQVRYSLPADVVAFTGRDGELGLITAVVTEAARAGEVVAVGAVDGMPGVGKTMP